MPTYSAYNSLGSTVETSEVTDNAISYAKLGDVLKAELLETLTFSGDTTKTTGTLTAYNQYLIILDVTETGGNNILLRCNGDTGANYRYLYINNVTVTSATAQSSILIGNTGGTKSVFEGIIAGKTRATAGGYAHGNFRGGLAGYSVGLTGGWGGGNDVQITDFTIFSTGTMTGTAKIYGIN